MRETDVQATPRVKVEPPPSPRHRSSADPIPSSRAPDPGWWLIAIPIVLSVGVFHGAFRYGFAQDDWIRLETASRPLSAIVADLVAPGSAGRRPVEQIYFALLTRMAGLRPWVFHLAAMLLHAGNVILIHALLRRLTTAPMALLGATLFAVHMAAFTVLYWTACAPELLCALFSFAAIAAFAGTGRIAGWSGLLFAAALCAKETALLLPVVAWAYATAAGIPMRMAARRALPLALIAVAYVLLYVFLKSGIEDSAYPIDLHPLHVVDRLSAYLTWGLGFFLPMGFSDTPGRVASVVATVLFAGFAAAAIRGDRRSRALGLCGLVWFSSFLLPALLIDAHIHRYLLYLALPGIIMVALPGLESLLPHLIPRPDGMERPGGTVLPIAITMAIAIGAAALAAQRTEGAATPTRWAWTRHHFVIRRALVATRALADLSTDLEKRPATLGPETTIVFMGNDRRTDWWDANFRTALGDGAALRVKLAAPGLDVRFLGPGDSFAELASRETVRFYVYDKDGSLRRAELR